MCKHGMTTVVRVKVPADLSHTGRERWKDAAIDSCIAPIVKALQEGGIDMSGSCCGHGKGPGEIYLQDGRVLVLGTDPSCGLPSEVATLLRDQSIVISQDAAVFELIAAWRNAPSNTATSELKGALENTALVLHTVANHPGPVVECRMARCTANREALSSTSAHGEKP